MAQISDMHGYTNLLSRPMHDTIRVFQKLCRESNIYITLLIYLLQGLKIIFVHHGCGGLKTKRPEGHT